MSGGQHERVHVGVGRCAVVHQRAVAQREQPSDALDEGEVVRWRWQRISTALAGLHIVLVWSIDEGAHSRLCVTSAPCKQPMGQWAWTKPPHPQGAVVASIGRIEPELAPRPNAPAPPGPQARYGSERTERPIGNEWGFVPLLVSEPVIWSAGG